MAPTNTGTTKAVERKVVVTAKENFTDTKTGVAFLAGRALIGLYNGTVVRFPARTIFASEVVITPDKFNERLDLLYLSDAQVLAKLSPASATK
jgi:hypothetical protein